MSFVGRNRKRRGFRGVIRKCLFLLLLFVLYILIGGIAPFIKQKDVSSAYKETYHKEDYYREGISVDRALVVETSNDAMDIRLDMINSATDRILFTTFSMKPDEACEKICAALYEAANRGVQVKILIDGLSGSWDMKNHAMFYALGTHKNVTMKYYNTFYVYAPWTFNGRLHDKFIVVDENQLILGGRNTSNYFLGDYNKKVLSYDREVYVYNTADTMEDSVILEVSNYFDSLWDSKYSKETYCKVPSKKKDQVKHKKEDYVKLVKTQSKENKVLWDLQPDYIDQTMQVNHISLITNPIHIYSKEPQVWYTLKMLMMDAKKKVLIQSPYVVLNDVMYDSFQEIGESLDQFDLLINSIAAGDNLCASSDYKYSKKEVLKTGVNVYEFQGGHSMHNKSLVIDDRLSIIGSFNFDMRSTYLDTETMLVIDGKEFAKDLTSKIDTMKKESILVLDDGSYDPSSKVEVRELSTKKKTIFSFLPFLLRPIRFLL